jgi:hypothetical protein
MTSVFSKPLKGYRNRRPAPTVHVYVYVDSTFPSPHVYVYVYVYVHVHVHVFFPIIASDLLPPSRMLYCVRERTPPLRGCSKGSGDCWASEVGSRRGAGPQGIRVSRNPGAKENEKG